MALFQSRTATASARRHAAVRLSASLAVAWGVTLGASAHAQTAMDAARGAFERGLAHDAAGKPDEACAAYRESLGLVRELGPLRKVAACDARAGRVRAAAALLEELLRRLPAEDGERGQVRAELDAVRRRAAHLAVKLTPGVSTAARVSIDGEVVAVPAADLILDPGSHTALVEVPGETPTSSTFELEEGAREALTLPVVTASAPLTPPPGARPTTPPRDGGRPLRTAGWIVGAVGVAGFVGVGVTGGLLLGEQSDFAACRDRPGCDASALADDAQPLVAANTVAWGLGIAGLGVGATLLIVDAASADAPRVEARLAPGGASVVGRF